MISPSLKERVAVQIFASIIKQNHTFKDVIKQKIDDLQVHSFVLKQKIANSKIFKRKAKDIVISMIVSLFVTELKQPEDVIMHQFDDSTDMYIIAKGECVVNIRNERNEVMKNYRVLTSTDYFGEISLIYGCKRTASVVSRKYTTLAKLTRLKFKEITTEFPEMTHILKKRVFEYKDRGKRFMKGCLKKIEYFQGVSEEAIHDVMYNMEVINYQVGDILQKPGDVASTLLFVQDGVVEVYAEFDDHQPFVIERLFRGSMINYRTWFMEDNGQVFLRIDENAIIQSLPLEKFNEVCKKHADLESKFLRFQKKIFLDPKGYPLDYIINLPSEHRNR